MKQRNNDVAEIVHFRNHIYEKQSEGWFFNTREGMAFGPYESKAQAIYARQLFVFSVTGDEKHKPSDPEQAKDLFMVEDCPSLKVNKS